MIQKNKVVKRTTQSTTFGEFSIEGRLKSTHRDRSKHRSEKRKVQKFREDAHLKFDPKNSLRRLREG